MKTKGLTTRPDRRRLSAALLLSLLIHALLLSLSFGGDGLGLPGLSFFWRDRRIEVPDLRVVLVPGQIKAAPPALIEQPVVGRQAPTTAAAPAVAPEPKIAATARAAEPTVSDIPPANSEAIEMAKPESTEPPSAASAKAPLPNNGSGDASPPSIAGPAVIALEKSEATTLVVPVAPTLPTPVITAAPNASSSATVIPAQREAGDPVQEQINPEARERDSEPAKIDRVEQEARRQAAAQQEAARQAVAQQEAARQAVAQQEAARQVVAQQEAVRQAAAQQEAVRQAAAQQEAARQAVARQEAARQAVAQQEAAQQEAARQAVAQQEAARQAVAQQEAARQAAAQQEAARQAAAQQEAARQAAAQQEAARQAAAQQEAARQAAAQQEAARLAAAQQEAARLAAAQQEAARLAAAQQEAARLAAAQFEQDREAARRAMGRQLNEEAARREAASLAARQLPTSSNIRRARLFGRADPNVELIQYAEAWGRKIELNMTFDMVREAAKQPHTDPLVTVAVRSDGSVESITFVRSSGVAGIDEAIRRIVQSLVHYPAFPPGLAREYDVIEIRRTWIIDTAIRLQ